MTPRRLGPAPLSLGRVPRLRGGFRVPPAWACAPERPLARTARTAAGGWRRHRHRSSRAGGPWRAAAERRRTLGAPRADEALLDELAERIASAPRGLVLAGRRAGRRRSRGPVFALAAAAGYPVLAEPTSQMRWAHDPPSSIVTSYSEGIARGRPEALEPELVIQVGDLPTSKPTAAPVARRDRAASRRVVIDPDGAWKKQTAGPRPWSTPIPRAVAAGLAERLKAGGGGGHGALGRGGGAWLAGMDRCRPGDPRRNVLERARGRK